MPERRYDLTCWYLNRRRIEELLGSDTLARYMRQSRELASMDEATQAIARVVASKNALAKWLQRQDTPTLGQLLTKHQLEVGCIFTHQAGFFCKGLPRYSRTPRTSWSSLPPPVIHTELDDFRNGLKLTISYHPEHLVSNSSWHQLQRRNRLFTVALVQDLSSTEVKAIPYLIGSMILPPTQMHIVAGRWNNYLEVHVDSVESFSKVADEPVPSTTELEELKAVPETDVKEAFAQIIGEPVVPKDWGGERSDMFSSYIRLDGNRISTAIAFKGPSEFHPLTCKHLGKNGDQIERLFSEPADLLILQHCHQITKAVRATMRAFATQIGRPRLFCLINGYDTLRILRAYGKCGLGKKSLRGKSAGAS